MKFIYVFILLTMSSTAHGQKPSIRSMSLSIERLISDIDVGLGPRDPMYFPEPFNLPKRTYAINVQTKVDLYKNVFHIWWPAASRTYKSQKLLLTVLTAIISRTVILKYRTAKNAGIPNIYNPPKMKVGV